MNNIELISKKYFSWADSFEDEIGKFKSELHNKGPVNQILLEKLAYAKLMYPEKFKPHENSILYLMGLFYKTEDPVNLFDTVYSIMAETISDTTGCQFTPVQADAYNHILEQKCFSFSAPTSAGKSHMFRELIKRYKGDIIIVVPSRALISEYIFAVREITSKSTLVLQFIEDINKAKVNRRVYIITPERGVELFKLQDKLNVTLFLLDEAQLSEEEIRGMKFDAFVRRIENTFPKAKKVFAHPFIENPEAQLIKHGFSENSGASKYDQSSVGKVYIMKTKQNSKLFSPFLVKDKIIGNINDDHLLDIIRNNGTMLIYISKIKIYTQGYNDEFDKYIRLCPKLTNEKALDQINQLREFIGASKFGEKHSTLIELMERGIVIHHGSIPLKARLIIEKFVKDNYAKICFATSTLIQGINMPFDIVWIDNFHNMKSLNLKNLIGRAGRTTKKKGSFDFGYVVIKENNLNTFCLRMAESTELSELSKLDYEFENIHEDVKDLVEAIQEDAFNDEYHVTESVVERLNNESVDKNVLYILDSIVNDNKAMTTDDYYSLKPSQRNKVKESFRKIYTDSLRRKELNINEKRVLSASIPILLWQIEGKSFKEVVSLRYSFLSRRDEKNAINKKVKSNELSKEKGKQELDKLYVKSTPPASPLPSSNLGYFNLYKQNTPVHEIDYDILVYDTYDYLDKVISLSLSDTMFAAFNMYFKKTGDSRADLLSKLIRYGTSDDIEIWLLKYGFSFEDIEWLTEHVDFIDENQIVFYESINNVEPEKLEIVDRYI